MSRAAKSWGLMFGTVPLPEKIRNETQNVKPKKPRELSAETQRKINDAMQKEIAKLKKTIARLIKAKNTIREIYVYLLENNLLPKNQKGRYLSRGKITSMITDERQRLGLSISKRNNYKLAYDLKNKGVPDVEIAAMLGVKIETVRAIRSIYRRRTGLSKPQRPETTSKLVFDMREKGLTNKQIAEHFGYKIRSIQSIYALHKKRLRDA